MAREEDFLGQAKELWESLLRRTDAAEKIGWTSFKGLTWDLVTKGKSPLQTLQEVRKIAENFERKEKEYQQRRRA